jgi:hypothetical protein
MECAFDVAAITETWLRDGDDPVILNLRPPGFNFTGQNRPIAKSKGRGGGLALLIRDSIPYERLETRAFETFESLSVRLKKTSACIALLYRPPPSPENGYTVNGFFSEFEEYVSSLLVAVPGNLYLMGDFNFHLENPADARSNRFSSLLTSFGLRQHVHSPTHRDGGVLDLVITRDDGHERSISTVCVHKTRPSDHHVVSCCLQLQPPRPSPRKVKARPLRRLDTTLLADKLRQSLSLSPAAETLDDTLMELNSRIGAVMDELVPERVVKVKGETTKAWYTDLIHEARRKRRTRERKYRKTGLEVHKQLLQDQRLVVVSLVDKAKSTYFQNEFANADSKKAFKLLGNLLNVKPPALSTLEDPRTLSESLAAFFTEKINRIRSTMDAAPQLTTIADSVTPPSGLLDSFHPVEEDQVTQVIMRSASKSCSLDPLPTHLLKVPAVMAVTKGPITSFINTSLIQGTVPLTLKIAQVSPRLKKPGLDTRDPSNFRPISNLPTIEKVLEKVVAAQLQDHLRLHNILDPLQSAYRPLHSTETAILRIQHDINMTMDKGDAVLLVMLDLSAAFDTLDHDILLNRLQQLAGITGTALEWISSYLSNRKQFVKIGDAHSDLHDLNFP